MNETFTKPRELDRRESDGISVTLLWYQGTDRVAVRVVDGKSDEKFEFDIEGRNALDAFRHPYAYRLPDAA
jgi:hypothetical protein